MCVCCSEAKWNVFFVLIMNALIGSSHRNWISSLLLIYVLWVFAWVRELGVFGCMKKRVEPEIAVCDRKVRGQWKVEVVSCFLISGLLVLVEDVKFWNKIWILYGRILKNARSSIQLRLRYWHLYRVSVCLPPEQLFFFYILRYGNDEIEEKANVLEDTTNNTLGAI